MCVAGRVDYTNHGGEEGKTGRRGILIHGNKNHGRAGITRDFVVPRRHPQSQAEA